MKSLRNPGVVFLLLLCLVPGELMAEDGSQGAQKIAVPGERPADVSSANYEKREKLLPGEEVITPTGQKLRVWSTEGPVEVSPPPEPFQDPEQSQVLEDAHVVVDAEAVRRKRNKPENDSFDVDKPAPVHQGSDAK